MFESELRVSVGNADSPTKLSLQELQEIAKINKPNFEAEPENLLNSESEEEPNEEWKESVDGPRPMTKKKRLADIDIE